MEKQDQSDRFKASGTQIEKSVWVDVGRETCLILFDCQDRTTVRYCVLRFVFL